MAHEKQYGGPKRAVTGGKLCSLRDDRNYRVIARAASKETTGRLAQMMRWVLLILAISSAAMAQTMNRQEKARADEENCVTDLRTFNVAQITYRAEHEQEGFASNFQSLGPKGDTLIDSTLASGEKDGYRFRLIVDRQSSHRTIGHYAITAVPVERIAPNQRSFFTDETGVIRFTQQKRPPTVKDSPLLGTPSDMLRHTR